MNQLKRIFVIGALIFSGHSAVAQVLYIGDSHSAGEFGAELATQLEAWSGSLGVDRFAVCGSSAITWSKDQICLSSGNCPYKNGYEWSAQNGSPAHHESADPTGEPVGRPGFKKLAENTKYSAYVFALGTNDAYNSHCVPLPSPTVDGPYPAKRSDAGAIAGLLEAIPKMSPMRPCIWIGPPAYTQGPMLKSCGSIEKYNEWVTSLKNFVEGQGKNCKFILSTDKPVGNELHFRPKAAKAWADKIAKEITETAKPQIDESFQPDTQTEGGLR